VTRQAAERLTRQFPGLRIVGTHPGYFPASKTDAVIEQINRVRPHILLVGMGVPTQEKWLWQHRERLRVPVLWGVGALFDYYAGVTPRAPAWLRRLGLEWSFRLFVEPKRLWRRYLFGNAFFMIRTLALVLTDAALVTASWLGAYGICRGLHQPLGVTLNPFEPYLHAATLVVGIWLLTCAGFGLYRRAPTMSPLAELSQVIRVTWVGMLSTMAAAFLLREASFGRPVVLVAGGLIFASLSVSRLLIRALERRLARQGIGLRRAMIVGGGPLAARLKQEIETSPIGYDVVGFVADGDANGAVPAADVVGPMRDLERLIEQYQVEDVFIASQSLRLQEELNLSAAHERRPVHFHIVSEELKTLAQRLPLGRVVELPLLDLPSEEPSGWYEWSKRVCDLAVSGAALALLWPVMGLIALVVKLESPGPALFVQERIGQGGRRFAMLKFRTMLRDAPAYAVSPNDLRDPRVTPVGRVLRRWSLDELPQLFNVLRGDMSLVGPRPEMPFLVEQYQPWQRRRLSVRPGVSGLWQVMGRKELPLQRNIEYDLYYVRHRGWLLDLTILLRTLPTVLLRQGAF
jgi:exopolysaccharide biosynthesis polyprenyl glycosylphosphotransferase